MAEERTATAEREQTTTFELPPLPEAGNLPAVVEQDMAYRPTTLDQALLEVGPERVAEIVKGKINALTEIRRAALRATSPQDWVLFKDRDENVKAHLCDSGARKVAQFYGISVGNVRVRGKDGWLPAKDHVPTPWPVPDALLTDEQRTSGVKLHAVYLCVDGFSRVTGDVVRDVVFGRRTDEQFIGRADRLDDLVKSTRTGADAKVCRILAGMTAVESWELEEVWQGSRKSLDGCRKGHGYGTSSERGASKVAEEGVADAAEQLWNEIVARVGGDDNAAKSLLKEVTAGKNFAGFTQYKRMTKDWQVENAWKALRKHPTFGDQAETRQPGDEPDGGRFF